MNHYLIMRHDSPVHVIKNRVASFKGFFNFHVLILNLEYLTKQQPGLSWIKNKLTCINTIGIRIVKIYSFKLHVCIIMNQKGFHDIFYMRLCH